MGKKIFVFGASIVQGYFDYEKGGWAQRLNLYFWKNSDDISVFNLGVSGDTTDDVLARFEFELKRRGGDSCERTIIFSVGVNDSSFRKSLGSNKVLIKNFEDNIKRLIVIGKKYTNKIIFLGLTFLEENKLIPTEWSKDAFYYLDNAKIYSDTIKKMCEKENLYFIDMFDLLKKNDLEDGLHPNAKGHEKIFEKVKDYLIENKII